MTPPSSTSIPPLRWGILGTGGIAHDFVGDLPLLSSASVTAVGSRRQETADAFGDEFGIAHRHTDAEALADDDTVDAVYVSTPHPMHFDGAMAAIDAGKAVLVEKAFTVNAGQAEQLVRRAREKQVFLMEAMWTRFLPHIVAVRDVLASGRLGDIVTVSADHGQWFPDDPENRLFAPALGGGALLDLGIYPLSFASMILGPPKRMAMIDDPAFTGVDGQISVVLGYDGGAQAVVNTTLRAVSPTVAAIVGRDARLEIDSAWYRPSRFTITDRDGHAEAFEFPHEGHGLRYEAAEVARCVAAGQLESAVMPLDETVQIMGTMDEIRRRGGYSLPGDPDS
ncbi:MAG: hypothetical protein QOD07_456 [Frankiaceae bacterium]|nr:hypothetical protein [Frankiaceae bacterium]